MKDTIRTKRLTLTPMTEDELFKLADAQTNEHLKKAYGEMLAGCRAHPSEALWYTAWKITRKDGIVVGDLCFKGTQIGGEVEIGYGIEGMYRRCGYATEAVGAACSWAMRHKDVGFVSAEVEPGNSASRRVLEKNGFKSDGRGVEGHRFLKEERFIPMTMVLLCVGMVIGMVIGGVWMESMEVPMTLGMLSGMAFGAAFDAVRKKRMEECKARHEQSRKADIPSLEKGFEDSPRP